MLFLMLALCLCLFAFFYQVAALWTGLPSGGYARYLKAVRKVRGTAAADRIRAMVNKLLYRLIKLSPEKRERLQTAFSRCNIKMTPEEYYLKAAGMSVSVFLTAFLFIWAGLPLAAFGSIILGVLIYFRQIRLVHGKLEKLNRQILEELPGFIRSFSYGLNSSRDIVAIIEKYRAVAKPVLASELDLLLANMKTENYETALKKFDERLSLEPVSAFVSGIIGINRGIDYRTYFYLLEENMKNLSRENLKREIARRPGKLKIAIIITILCLFFMYMVPIIVQLSKGFNLFK